MALTPEIRATKLAPLVVARFSTPELLATKLAPLVVFNYPTPEIPATKLTGLVTYRTDRVIQATKLAPLVVALGRQAHPAISPWTFTIDEHEFLVINLQDETLVYDFFSEKWSCYGIGDTRYWTPQVGQNWNAGIGNIIAPLAVRPERISNVVCGDGTTSALYFLDPELNEDYSAAGVPAKAFKRVVTGQLVSRNQDYTPLPAVTVMSSEGQDVVASDMTVELKFSDDQGNTYQSFGTRSVVLGEYSNALEWRSLGSFKMPGRLLQLIDYGALVRVDDWQVPGG